MTGKSMAVAVLVILMLVAGVIGVRILATRTTRGAVFEQYVFPNPTVQLRVTAFREKGIVLPIAGAYYVFEQRRASDEAWKQILIFRSDDALPIPKDQIRAVNDEVVYFFIGWVYGVTSDGGKGWSVWDAEKDLSGWKPANYKFIKDVQLTAEGRGKMSLNPIRFDRDTLFTDDFGRSWSIR